MTRTLTSKITLVAVVAALAGALAALFAVAFTNPAASGAQGRYARHFARHHFGLASRAVHAEAVVPADNGTEFKTVTFDRGTVKSLSGNDLILTEGTKKATYRDVTLTIPSGAKVRVNGRRATLSGVQEGMKAAVVQGVNHTFVIAHQPRTTAAARRHR